jgi:hypothetical protein
VRRDLSIEQLGDWLQQPPYRGLELRGRPQLIEDGAMYATVLRRIAVRYLRTCDFADDFSP